MSGLWAIIPARGGSKGLPHKNLRSLGGRALVSHAIDAASSLPAVSRVIVSTDDPAIADVARRDGAEVPFLRPASLASDYSELRDSVEYTVDRLAEAGGPPDRMLVLYPTHPFRSRAVLERATKLLEVYAQVSSATPMEVDLGGCHAVWHGRTIPLASSAERMRLYLPTGSFMGFVYAPPGLRNHENPAGWRRYIEESGSRTVRPCGVLQIVSDAGAHLDINTPEDFRAAEAFLRGEAPPPEVPLSSLPYCAVGMRRLCPSFRARGARAELPVRISSGERLIVAWRACGADGVPFGPSRFHRLVGEGDKIACHGLFRERSKLRATRSGERLLLHLPFLSRSEGAWIGLGCETRDDLCDLAKPFSLRPIWSYDSDTGLRRNLLSGRVIRGRQDLPVIISRPASGQEQVA